MKTVTTILLLLAFTAGAQNQSILAVIDLQNEGGVTQSDIDLVCDAIAREAERDARFYVFDRSLIDQILEETGIPQSNTCSHEQCLATMGNLLAAQKIIGGSIKRVDEKTSIELILVDVTTTKVENSILLEKQTSRSNMLSIHIPRAVTSLLTGKASGERKEFTQKRKRRWWLPVTGILAIGAAGAGAYMYLENEESSGENGGGAIPMDDVPVRTR